MQLSRFRAVLIRFLIEYLYPSLKMFHQFGKSSFKMTKLGQFLRAILKLKICLNFELSPWKKVSFFYNLIV